MNFIPVSKALVKQTHFVQGKGGVGKTTLAKALELYYQKQGLSTLCVNFEAFDWSKAFEEYLTLRTQWISLVSWIAKTPFIKKLLRLAPGIRELIFLGKLWHETQSVDRVIVDMPSTGHGVTLFRSFFEWENLLSSGPMGADTDRIASWLTDTEKCQHWVVTLPEEMPLQEADDLAGLLQVTFPKGFSSTMLVNMCLPDPTSRSPDFLIDRQKRQSELLASRGFSEFAKIPKLLNNKNLEQQVCDLLSKFKGPQ